MTREERLDARERVLTSWETAVRQHERGELTDDQLAALRLRADRDLIAIDHPTEVAPSFSS